MASARCCQSRSAASRADRQLSSVQSSPAPISFSSWNVKNEGEGDLELWKGTSTCMCTFAKFKDGEKAVLKPGESTDIEVVWKTNRTHGDFRKGANIETNDPNVSTIPLFVHGLLILGHWLFLMALRAAPHTPRQPL